MPHNLLKYLFGKPASARRTSHATPRRPKLFAELLEDRTVLAAHFATGAAVGAAGVVTVRDRDTQQQVTTLTPYGADFTGGVNVAMGDVTGDGTADIITATATGGSHVKVFDGATFAEVRSFKAFADGFVSGINVAAGDIDKDGRADIVIGAAAGPSNVAVFSGATGSSLHSFLAYDPAFVGGVRVAVGDINGDGQKDIVTGSGAGADGNVRVFDGATEALLRSFTVFTGGFNGGLNVAAGDLDGDGADDILVGAGPSAGPHVKSFDGRTGREGASFFAFDPAFAGGVFVSVVNGTGGNEIAVGATGTQHVKTFDGSTFALLSSAFLPAGTVAGGLGAEPANAAPVLAPIGNRTGAALQPISFTLSATDANPGDTLTFSATGLPAGATLDAKTGAFSWTPTLLQNGTFTVTFTVSDGKTSDFETVAFAISATNVAPAITSNGGGDTAAVSVPEGTTAVTTVTATDPNSADTLTYSIAGGADAAKFTINSTTGALSFLAAPDFETPTDVGGDNVYDVIVQVSDGSLTDTQSIAVTVTATNDNPPVITSNGGGATGTQNVAENTTAVTTVTATDADAGTTLTYSIVSVANGGAADAALFTIDPSTGVLSFLAAPDFETPTDAGGNNVYDVTVQVSDGTNTDTQVLAVTVTDANEAPVVTATAGPTAYTVGDPPAIIDAGITVADPDAGDMMAGATVAPGVGDYADGDMLVFDTTLATSFGITGMYDGGPSGTGVLTLTGAATAAQYQAVLQTVGVATNVPVSVTHTFTFTVDDGALTGSDSRDVVVTP